MDKIHDLIIIGSGPAGLSAHRTDHNVQTGDEIGQRKRRADRRTIRITGQIGHAGKRLQRGAQAGQMGIWSGLAVSCYMGDNNIGICLAKDIDAESPFVESPCSEIFNYNITLGDQFKKKFFPFLIVKNPG